MSGPTPFLRCLTHQRIEDQMSPIGLVCERCKQRLYVQPPVGNCRTFWESQPAAYSLSGEPCFVYTLVWDDFKIRSLHPAGSEVDLRRARMARGPGIDAQHNRSRAWG